VSLERELQALERQYDELERDLQGARVELRAAEAALQKAQPVLEAAIEWADAVAAEPVTQAERFEAVSRFNQATEALRAAVRAWRDVDSSAA
jgi:predicted  nucleic acid-binding Zn-ribbon protein